MRRLPRCYERLGNLPQISLPFFAMATRALHTTYKTKRMKQMTKTIIREKLSTRGFAPNQQTRPRPIFGDLPTRDTGAPATPPEAQNTTATQQVTTSGIVRRWDWVCERLVTYLRPRIFALWLLWETYSLSALVVCLLAIWVYARRYLR